MLTKIAKIFSVATHPYLTPIYLVLILLVTDSVFSLFPASVKLYLVWVMALYSLVLPVITRWALHFIGSNERYRIVQRYAEVTSLLASACCYMLCAITFMRSPALEMFHKVALAGFIATFLLLISLKWQRASAHLAALGTLTTFLIFLNIIGVESLMKYLLATILLSGCTATIHLYLGKESPLQLAVGYAIGITSCVVAMLLL